MNRYSFVIPCYRSERTIEKVVNEIIEIMKQKKNDSYEIILVNDCSPDGVWEVISKLANEHDNIVGISLAKNFGQHAALMAGYSRTTGDYIVSLDDDGQTPIDQLDVLLDKMNEGYDVVYAYYEEIKQKAYRKAGTWIANKLAESMLDMPKGFKGSSFYVAKRFIIDEILKYQNAYPYLGGLVFRTTKNIANVKTHHRDRIEGTSGYSFRKLVSLWLNGFTAFSVKPLEFGVYFGTFISGLGFIYAIYIIINKLMGNTGVEGWSSITSLLLIIGGIILIMLGLIGEYVGRIYISINNSPQYVICNEVDRRR